MKKSFGLLIALVCVAALFPGCGTVAMPVGGAFYADVSWPGDVGSGDGSAENNGMSYAESYLGVVAMGNASIRAAVDNAAEPIDSIAWIDYHAVHYFVYGKLETYVYGN